MVEPEPARAPRRPDWRRLADGVFLIGLGVFLLLNASGRLSWTFWYDALSLWPIVLVSAGLRIAVERTRVAWLALLGPVLVLATLAAVASGRLDGAPGPWAPVGVAGAEGTRQVSLHAALASSRVDVTARRLDGGRVLEGRQGSRGDKARVETKQEDGKTRVTLVPGTYGWGSVLPGRLSRWELGVPNDLPLNVDIEGAMIGARFELSNGRVEAAAFKGAFLGLDLHLPRPDARVRVEIRGVFNMVDVFVPEGTPVRVHGTGFPFNLVDRGTGGDPKNPATPGYDVEFAGVFSRIGVNDDPAAP